jgi:hypothetical protein
VKQPTVATVNPGKDKKALRIDAPRGPDAVTFASLPKLVEKRIPREVFAGASIPWYVATVKLDLEARGLIERIPGKTPQQVRRL